RQKPTWHALLLSNTVTDVMPAKTWAGAKRCLRPMAEVREGRGPSQLQRRNIAHVLDVEQRVEQRTRVRPVPRQSAEFRGDVVERHGRLGATSERRDGARELAAVMERDQEAGAPAGVAGDDSDPRREIENARIADAIVGEGDG